MVIEARPEIYQPVLEEAEVVPERSEQVLKLQKRFDSIKFLYPRSNHTRPVIYDAYIVNVPRDVFSDAVDWGKMEEDKWKVIDKLWGCYPEGIPDEDNYKSLRIEIGERQFSIGDWEGNSKLFIDLNKGNPVHYGIQERPYDYRRSPRNEGTTNELRNILGQGNKIILLDRQELDSPYGVNYDYNRDENRKLDFTLVESTLSAVEIIGTNYNPERDFRTIY